MADTKDKDRKDGKPLEPLLVGRVDAAGLLGVSPRTVDNLIRRRVLRARRIGARVLFLRADLENYARKLGRGA